MRKRLTGLNFVGLVLLLLLPGAAYTQSETVFKRLHGSWSGEGKSMGMPARLRMTWEWVLGEKFLRLSLKNEMTTPGGQVQLFEGHVYYLPGEGRCDGMWFDSRGISFPIKCTSDGQSLTALWGSPDQETGKSIYSFSAEGKLEVVDFVQQKDGSWKEFGRFVVSRD